VRLLISRAAKWQHAVSSEIIHHLPPLYLPLPTRLAQQESSRKG